MSAVEILNPDLDLKPFIKEVQQRAIAQFETPQYKRILSIPLSLERARVYELQKSPLDLEPSRLLGLRQALSPMAVKKLVWSMKKTSLPATRNAVPPITTPCRSRNVPRSASRRRISRTPPRAKAHAWRSNAWIHLVKDSPWLESRFCLFRARSEQLLRMGP